MSTRKTTILRQLILNIIVPVIIAILLFSAVSYYLNYKNLQENYQLQRKQIEQRSIDLLGIYDLGLSAHESTYATRMGEISNKLVHQYFRNTNGIDTLIFSGSRKKRGSIPRKNLFT